MSGSDRNAPCPCGSGRKYKVCCLRRDEAEETERGARHGGVGVAIAWLDERCPGAADEVIETGFYSIVDDDGFDRLAELPAHVQDLAELNAFDWLLADGEMALDDEGLMVPVTDMVLGDGGPALFEAQRQHLEALRASPLRLYRVEQVAGEHRMIVRDVLDPTTPLEVKQGAWAGEFRAGNLRGMRLLPGVPPEPSGALFPYPDALADEVVGSIRDAVAALRGVSSIHAPGYDERKFVAKTIISTWLMFLVGPLPEARARSTERKHTDRKGRRLRAARDPFIVDGGSGDPALLVTDRYEVRDWDRLAAALAAQPEVEGSRQHGWVKVEPGGSRPLLAINLGEEKDRLEPFARTQRLADEGRAWLERIAGDALRFLSREVVDPNDPATLRSLVSRR